MAPSMLPRYTAFTEGMGDSKASKVGLVEGKVVPQP